MILSAQRVLSTHGIAGVNTYAYRHPPGGWSSEDLSALEDEAVLVLQDFEVPPGGNAVRSYLDLFVPDDCDTTDLTAWLKEILDGPDPEGFPVELRKGVLALRFGLVFGLVPTWRREFTDLAGRVLLLVQGSGMTRGVQPRS